jgi:GT2 family glycosyltransferase
MKLGYVCINFNNTAVTIEAIESLVRNTGHDLYTVVVDNASQQDEQVALASYCKGKPHCVAILNRENVGYFPGLNLGIERIRAERPDINWLVIGNNDLEFSEDFVNRLEGLQDTYAPYCVVSPDIVTLDGAHQNPHVVSGLSPLREAMYDLYYSDYYIGRLILNIVGLFPRRLSERGDEKQWQQPREIYQGHGSCYILTPKFFEKIDRLWAPTFLYYEEYFLSHQLAEVGERILYHPGVSILHKCHHSFSKLPKRKVWKFSRDAHREYRKYVSIHGVRPAVCGKN